MALFCQQSLLLLVLSIVLSECKDIFPEIEMVHGSQKEAVALPCFLSMTDPKSCYRVKLLKHATDASQTKVILVWPTESKSPDAGERVKLKADENGQMSLVLTTLQKSDEGLYSCEIWRGWHRVLFKNISLKVKDCKTLQPVKAVLSTHVYLNCPLDTVSGQAGIQNVSWKMLKGDKPVAVSSERGQMNGTSLSIRSVDFTDSGWYRCKYMLGHIQLCFETNLLVEEEHVAGATVGPALPTSEMIWKTNEGGSIEGPVMTETINVPTVVAPVVVGIVAMAAALVGMFIHRRRTTQRVTQRAYRHPSGTKSGSTDGYETVDLSFTPCHDPANQRINSLCQQDENLSLYS